MVRTFPRGRAQQFTGDGLRNSIHGMTQNRPRVIVPLRGIVFFGRSIGWITATGTMTSGRNMARARLTELLTTESSSIQNDTVPVWRMEDEHFPTLTV